MAKTEQSKSQRRVLVNDRPLLGARTGVGQYLAGVLGAWPEDQPAPVGVVGRVSKHRLASVGPCPFVPGSLDSLGRVVRTPLIAMRPRADSRGSGVRGAKRAGYAAGARAALSAMRRRSPSVHWEPNHHPLVARREGSPVVTTIHDLSVLTRPEFHPPDRVRSWETALPKTLEHTSAFIAVSGATAGAVERELGVPAERIHTIPLAPRFGHVPEGWSRPACRRALGLSQERQLVVHLGTIEPRKNIGVLLDAWKILAEGLGDAPDVLLVGGGGWGDAGFWHRLTQHTVADRVRATGYVSDAAALALLIAADVVVCPSWLEGFGLPAVEAMHAGTPVVVSTDPALCEAVGPLAGHAIEAGDAEGWAREIRSLLESPELAASRAHEGRAHASRRGWEDVARDHAEVFSTIQ